MLRWAIVIGVCAAVLLGIGTSPRYVEELRIGGGYSEAVDGGADLDKAGNISTDGALKVTGSVEVGKDSNVRGLLTLWDGSGGNAPGCLRLNSADGTARYLFVTNDGAGLRIHNVEPTSNADGDWVAAGKFRGSSSITDAVDLGTAEVAGTLAASSVGNGLTDAQVNNDLTISGGTINNTPIGGATASTGKFTSLSAQDMSSSGGNLTLDLPSSSAGTTLTITNSDASREASLSVEQGLTLGGDIAVNGADITTTATGTATVFNTTAGAVSIGGAATALSIGASTGGSTCTIGSENLTVGNGTISRTLRINGGSGGYRGVQFQTAGLNRWWLFTDQVAEGGSNTGSDFHIYRYTDAGAYLGEGLSITRSTGLVSLGSVAVAGNIQITGVLSSSTITTFTANDTTPNVSAGNLFKVPNTWTSGNNITMFDSGVVGEQIVVIGGDADCIVVDGGNLKLSGNWTAAADDTLRLVFDGTNWFEIGRSDN